MNNSAVKGIYEKEPLRLQREADDFTRKVETQKKQKLRTEDALKNGQGDVDKVITRIKDMIPSEEEVHGEMVKRAAMTHKVRHKKVLCNNTLGVNKALINQIESMRREIMFANTAIDTLKAAVSDLKHDAR